MFSLWENYPDSSKEHWLISKHNYPEGKSQLVILSDNIGLTKNFVDIWIWTAYTSKQNNLAWNHNYLTVKIGLFDTVCDI